jgi:hypothetical protein
MRCRSPRKTKTCNKRTRTCNRGRAHSATCQEFFAPPAFGVRARCSSYRLGVSADARCSSPFSRWRCRSWRVVPPVLQVIPPALQVSVFGWDLGHCRPLETHNALQVTRENRDLQQ